MAEYLAMTSNMDGMERAPDMLRVQETAPWARGDNLISTVDTNAVEFRPVNMTREYSVNGDDNDVTDAEVKGVQIEVDSDDLDFDENCYTRAVFAVQDGLSRGYSKHKKNIMTVVKIVLFLGYLGYFSYCMYYSFGDEGSIRLIIGTAIGILYLVNKLTPDCGNASCLQRFSLLWRDNQHVFTTRTWIRRILYVLFTVGVGVYIGLEIARTDPSSLQSLLGVAVFVVIGFFMSTSPARVNWHPVFWGIGVQFLFAVIILRTAWGYAAVDWLGHRVEEFLAHGNAGAKFVFGASYRDHRIAFAVMPIMLFFNSIIFLLYHIGVIQIIIKTLGTFLAFCMDTGPIESVVASANIFIGLTEAPLLVRPFLNMVTSSELHAIMTCGFASIGGGVLGAYVQFGVPAKHLLSASVMSAPAALAITKLMCPETKKSAFGQGIEIELGIGCVSILQGVWSPFEERGNDIYHVSSGAVTAVKIAANILANQIAFVSLLQFADMTLEWFGDRAGTSGLSFGLACSYLFYPISYVMGVAPEDCGKMGAMLGKKIFGTPIISYIELGTLRENRKALLQYVSQNNDTWNWVGDDIYLTATNQTLLGGIMNERSEVIGTYALCGFSTVTAVGITLGSLIPMAPERKEDVIRLVIRALIAGNIASFLTGATAGLLFNGESV